MRNVLIFIGMFAATVTAAAGQQPDARMPHWIIKPLAMTGCNRPDDTGGGDRPAAAQKWATRTKHRAVATGAVAHLRNGIRVAGGLIPTPNIAAQAGDIDPTIAMMAFLDRYPEWTRSATRRAARPAADGPIPFPINCSTP